MARIKLARLLETEGTLSNDEAARPEIFEEAAVRIVGGQEAEGLTTWTDAELQTMALVSRTLGSARTSDLHAWDWTHVDTVHWLDAHVPRPKTKSGDRMVLPDVLVPVLRAWWDSHGRPLSGPVFPCRRGSRAGERKGKGISHASALRDALMAAGIVRPAPGFEQATTDTERRKLCLIQSGSTELRPLDFHSFSTRVRHRPG